MLEKLLLLFLELLKLVLLGKLLLLSFVLIFLYGLFVLLDKLSLLLFVQRIENMSPGWVFNDFSDVKLWLLLLLLLWNS